MIKDIEQLRKQMLRVLKETAELRQQYKEEQEARRADRRDIFLSIIQQLDDLDQEEQKAMDLIAATEDKKTIQEHYTQLKTPLLRILQKYNIKALSAPFNQLPDFSVTEQTVQNEALEEGAVVAVLSQGYLIGDQLFRPTGLCKVKNS